MFCAKISQAMKLTKKVSTKHSTIFLILVFILGLSAIGWFHYLVNIQYQKSNKPFLNGPLTMPPKTLRLDLSSPDDDILTFQNSILISGQTSSFRKILIFTDSQNLVIESKNDGSFSETLNLDEGENKISVVVFDTNGDTREAERTVYYSKEKL